MVSGVEWDEASYDWTDESKPLTRDWQLAIVEHRFRFVEGANRLPRLYQPGEYYNYSTLESCMLGWLIEAVTQQRMTHYFEQRVWQPMRPEFVNAAFIHAGTLEQPMDIELGHPVATGHRLALPACAGTRSPAFRKHQHVLPRR